MFQKHARLFWLPLLIAFAMVGCSRNDNPIVADGADDSQEEALDLEASFGGYSYKDELPAFGDDELLEKENDGVEARDALEADPAVIDLGARPDTKVYSVRLAWGMLEGDSTVTDGRDWSGDISVINGAVIVNRILQFEDRDYIERPRDDRRLVSVVSHTGPRWDGLLLTILDPQSDLTVINELVIDLGDFEMRWLVSDLDSLEEIIDVDDRGNQFSITAFAVDEMICPSGFIHGRWANTRDNGGVFRGRWTSRYGLSHGWLKGHYGVNDEGDNVFFGKYIGQGGEVRGLFRGSWGRADAVDHGGWFRGKWHNRGDVQGALGGRWFARPDRTMPPSVDAAGDGNARPEFAERPNIGFFSGRWINNCDGSMDEETDPSDESGEDEAGTDAAPDEV